MKKDTWGKDPMQFTVNTQKDSRIQELIDPAEGGVKQPHESSYSDK